MISCGYNERVWSFCFVVKGLIKCNFIGIFIYVKFVFFIIGFDIISYFFIFIYVVVCSEYFFDRCVWRCVFVNRWVIVWFVEERFVVVDVCNCYFNIYDRFFWWVFIIVGFYI